MGWGEEEKLVQNGTQHLTMLHIFSSLSAWSLFVDYKSTLSDQASTESKSFQLGVKIFSQSDFTAGPEKFIFTGP